MSIKVVNPLTKEDLYSIEPAGDEELKPVFAKARSVQRKIHTLSIKERIREAVKISQYLIDNYRRVTERIVRETGKTKFEALSNELFEICDSIDYYRDHAEKILKTQKVHTPPVLQKHFQA